MARGRRFVAAIDQGTTSSRCIVFDAAGAPVAAAQREFTQVFPRPGWVEHDPVEIWESVLAVTGEALARAGIGPGDLAAVGITNQRETAVLWEAATGRPVGNAVVWQDTRTDGLCRELAEEGGRDRFAGSCGLPLATYFSGPKVTWLLDAVPGLRGRAERGEIRFGTVESWLIWNLTGGLHVTDVTNASRTMLMGLRTLAWDEATLAALRIPAAVLPEIVPSSGVYGTARGVLEGVPVAAALGDQQAALFGQCCFAPGEAKNTYGTGSFLLLNTGGEPVWSRHGLLTTVAYQVGGEAPVYALEGSIAVTGSLVQWLRDNLRLISSAAEVEVLARRVPDSGGCVVVPAFSGLFAPYWRSDARGAIVGLTRFVTAEHLARAVLEATAWQTREIVEAMAADAGVALPELRVDGGMVVNGLLMQIQADVLGLPVVRPEVAETTALGAAQAAGLAVGLWGSREELSGRWRQGGRWDPEMAEEVREAGFARWKKAVTRTFDWV